MSQESASIIATQVGNPLIDNPAKPIPESMFGSDDLTQIVDKMRSINDSMGGVGISANQVGEPWQICLIHVKPTEARPQLEDTGELVMINPVVISTEGESTQWEGCLSVAEAGLFCKVKRPKSITVSYHDLDGKLIKKTFSGFAGRVVQHELSHVHDGEVFVQNPGADLSTLASRSEYIRLVALDT